MKTCPNPQRFARPCYAQMDYSADESVALPLDQLMAQFTCTNCPISPPLQVRWACAAASNVVDCHPGFFTFTVARDFMVLHVQAKLYESEYIPKYQLSTGAMVKKFVRTNTGLLCDIALQSTGTLLVFITGNSKHTSLYRVVDGKNVLNPQYSAMRSSFRAMLILTNPGQSCTLDMGRLGFDMNPKVLSLWASPFYNAWADFSYRNPGMEVTELYMTANGLRYGSESRSVRSFLLYDDTMLPLVLQYYRDILAKHIGRILAIGKMKRSDNYKVPKGMFLYE